MKNRVLAVIVGCLAWSGCSDSSTGGGAAPDATTSSSATTAAFVDVTEEAGFRYEHGYLTIFNDLIIMAGGVAAGDYDNDGWVDLFIVHGDVGPNLLFRNMGDGTFQEVGSQAGVDAYWTRGCGPAFADFNGDGWLDLFVGGVDGTLPIAYTNDGDGTFSDVTSTCGIELDQDFGTFSPSFADFDRDGDLDVFISHWGADYSSGAEPQHLWRNLGDGTFEHVPLPEVVDSELDFTFTANFADINSDGWPDLVIASDFRHSKVLVNHDGIFEDFTDPLVITDENGMGATVADYDHDGDLDWFVSSIYNPSPQPMGLWGTSGNRLYQNQGDGTFHDVTDLAGVREGGWGWGSSFGDLDNDGHPDIFHVNGFDFPHVTTNLVDQYILDRSRLFMSNGDGTFDERSEELGIIDEGQGRGVTLFDYDRDGDLDIFIANNNQPPRLYRNDLGQAKHFLMVRLENGASNALGVGARVYVKTENMTQMQELRCGSNFASQNPGELHFGLGESTVVDTVRVVWPDGSETVENQVPADQYLVITR